jgi:hypothetical protein
METFHLSIRTPLDFWRAVDAIPRGQQAYLTADEVRNLTGQTCQEFVARHHRVGRTRIATDVRYAEQERRLYFTHTGD